MKTLDLSIKELAAIIGVSTDTIRRAARRGEIPSTRVGTAYRFDLRQVRRQPAARHAERPRLVTRGHYPQGSLQEVYRFDEFTLHPHH